MLQNSMLVVEILISVYQKIVLNQHKSYVTPDSIPDESGGALVQYTGSRVYITGIWWGIKSGKQLDISRILNSTKYTSWPLLFT
jgi:hypothetical protein